MKGWAYITLHGLKVKRSGLHCSYPGLVGMLCSQTMGLTKQRKECDTMSLARIDSIGLVINEILLILLLYCQEMSSIRQPKLLCLEVC